MSCLEALISLNHCCSQAYVDGALLEFSRLGVCVCVCAAVGRKLSWGPWLVLSALLHLVPSPPCPKHPSLSSLAVVVKLISSNYGGWRDPERDPTETTSSALAQPWWPWPPRPRPGSALPGEGEPPPPTALLSPCQPEALKSQVSSHLWICLNLPLPVSSSFIHPTFIGHL